VRCNFRAICRLASVLANGLSLLIFYYAQPIAAKVYNDRRHLVRSRRDPPAGLLRRHLDQLDVGPEGQERRDHQRPLRIPHDGAERRGGRHPPEGDTLDRLATLDRPAVIDTTRNKSTHVEIAIAIPLT
jgi:hypothetical protein